MNMMTGLERAWVDVMIFVPRFVGFLFTLLVGYFVSAWLGKAVTKILIRMGFDRLVERGGIRAALERSGSTPSQIAGKITFYTLFLFVLQLGFGFFGTNPISNLLTQFIAFLPNIFVALAILVVSAWVASAVKDIVQATLGGLNYGRLLANVAAISIVVVGAFAALDQLHIAPYIVNGLFYAMLAVIAGSAIIAIGGGGIVPMRARWESMLSRIEQEAPHVQDQVVSAHRSMEESAEQSMPQSMSAEQRMPAPAGLDGSTPLIDQYHKTAGS